MDRVVGKPMSRSYDRKSSDEGAGVITDRHSYAINVFGKLAALDGVAGFANLGHLLAQTPLIDNRVIGVARQFFGQTLTRAAVRFENQVHLARRGAVRRQ